jgi:hypothetical protein
MRKALLILLLLPIAACNREQPAAPASSTSTARTAPAKPAVRAPLALKTPLPENFELPFAYNRLYDNSAKTKDGKAQRRVMVEFIGQDAAAIQTALTAALLAKEFTAPTTDQVDGKDRLTYKRADGTAVMVKIDAQPKRLLVKDARGTLHLTWDSASP